MVEGDLPTPPHTHYDMYTAYNIPHTGMHRHIHAYTHSHACTWACTHTQTVYMSYQISKNATAAVISHLSISSVSSL